MWLQPNFAQMVKNLPAMRETWVWSLGWEDPLEENMATHSSILAWRISMDRGAWWTTVYRVAKSQTRLSNWTELNWQSIDFSRPEYWSGLPCSPPGDLPNPGIGPRSPALQADSLPAEPQGKPKNTGVSSLSLHQWIFLTQGSNWGLLHCRWILYQPSYQGSTRDPKRFGKKTFLFFFVRV